MSNGYTVFLGDVAIDEYYTASYYPKLREKIYVKMLEPQMGGMIANAACVYSSYGNDTRFLSILNNKDKYLCEELNSRGIQTDMIMFDDKLPDSKCVILLAENEHTVLIVDRPIEKIELSKETFKQLSGADIIYSNYSELKPLRYNDMGSSEILAEWKKAGVKLVCDIDVAELDNETKDFFKYTHILFMNEIGFKNQMDGRTAEETVHDILNSGVEILVVTLAEKGCIIYNNDTQIEIEGIKTKVVDVTGAGDTFCSSFTFFYNISQDLKLSGKFANYAASLSIRKLGARGGAVGYKPVIEYMDSLGEDISEYLKYLNR